MPWPALGWIPPPQCLSSIPLRSGAGPGRGVTFSTPTQSTGVSWTAGLLAPGLTTMQRQDGTGVSLGPPPAGPVQPGLVLSPAAEPFPQKLVDRVRAGNFMEMRELLADNMSLLGQLEAVPGLSTVQMLGPTRPRLREVSSILTWCYCFLGYMAIRTTDMATRDQLAYARLLIQEAQRHGGQGWRDYDRAFRQQAAADPLLRWNTLNPSLQASTMLGCRPSGQGNFCTLCRGVDHAQAQCALTCLQPSATVATTVPRTAGLGRRRPESSGRTCISWNRGTCLFQGTCTYKHVCASCQSSQHPARDCAKTPEVSIYKRIPHQGGAK